MSPLARRLGVTLLLLCIAATAAADEPRSEDSVDRSRPGLEEDEFDSLDLLSQAARLRPRLRLQQDFTPQQEHDGTVVETYTTAFRASVAAPITKKFRNSGLSKRRCMDFSPRRTMFGQ